MELVVGMELVVILMMKEIREKVVMVEMVEVLALEQVEQVV
jgi:hypothetical protein